MLQNCVARFVSDGWVSCLVAVIVYSCSCCFLLGYAAGSPYTQTGSGSNYLCLPEDPQWKYYINGDQSSGSIAGVEYQLRNSGPNRNSIFSESNNGVNSLLNNPAPCAVCYVEGRSTILMIPAKTQCPDGWSTEYAGYVVSDHVTHKRRSYICVDEAPEVAVGAISQDQALFYPVEVHCGSLPCSLYPTGRELACIVCSKWWIQKHNELIF